MSRKTFKSRLGDVNKGVDDRVEQMIVNKKKRQVLDEIIGQIEQLPFVSVCERTRWKTDEVKPLNELLLEERKQRSGYAFAVDIPNHWGVHEFILKKAREEYDSLVEEANKIMS